MTNYKLQITNWLTRRKFCIAAFVICHLSFVIYPALACTSAIVSGRLSGSGRPLLWKNRDTSTIDNKVEYIAASLPGELAYVGLFNADDRDCEQAWIGVNEAGFAVMNTASYNLKDDDVPASKMDREGYLMALALKHCRSVEDFADLLDDLPQPLGVEANFGVVDRDGNGAYFECNNHDYTRFDLVDEPSGVLVRTNYSHSGRPGEGYGQIRERNANRLLEPYVKAGFVEPYTFTDELSCSYYHDLYGDDMSRGYRYVMEGDTLPAEMAPQYLVDQDFIPRYTTTASVVIDGDVRWVAMGYPPVAEVIPVTVAPDGVDPGLRGTEEGGTSRICNEAKARKAEVFSVADGNRNRYVDLSALFNAEGTGYLQHFRRLNRQTYDRFHRE